MANPYSPPVPAAYTLSKVRKIMSKNQIIRTSEPEMCLASADSNVPKQSIERKRAASIAAPLENIEHPKDGVTISGTQTPVSAFVLNCQWQFL